MNIKNWSNYSKDKIKIGIRFFVGLGVDELLFRIYEVEIFVSPGPLILRRGNLFKILSRYIDVG